jgi:hypothetical protein
MSALREAMQQYLSLRRSLGFRLIDKCQDIVDPKVPGDRLPLVLICAKTSFTPGCSFRYANLANPQWRPKHDGRGNQEKSIRAIYRW